MVMIHTPSNAGAESISTTTTNIYADAMRKDLDILQREKEIAARELALVQQETEMLRKIQSLTGSG